MGGCAACLALFMILALSYSLIGVYLPRSWYLLNVQTLQDEVGDLDRVDQVVKLFGIVNSADTFQEQHLVMNGCSDAIVDALGKDVAFHARSAIGTNALPLGAAVEVEAIVRVLRD